MKRLSIKLKITLYFTLIMILLASILLVYTASMSRRVARNELFETLSAGVNALHDRLHYKKPNAPSAMPERPNEDKKPPNQEDKGQPKLDIPEDVSYKVGDVYLAVFETDINGEVLASYGSLPDGISFDPKNATNGEKSSVTAEDGKYYVYKRSIKDPGGKDSGAWVVGAITAHMSASVAHGTMQLAMFAIPFIIIFAALLGYAITKRAFKPVSNITSAAAEIASSNDLSRRINLNGNGKDEIHGLAKTFDGMLDAIQANYEKEKQFTDDASHELRTPVAVILAQCQLSLAQNATEEELREAISAIHRQGLKMNKLLSELLTLARTDNNRAVYEMEHFDLVELTEMVIEELYSISKSKNISLSLETEESVVIYADRTAVMRVLINYLNNAIKYGKEGGFVKVYIEKNGEFGAVCKVQDNGIGIAAKDLDKIWNRFYRADASRTNDGSDSMGLGLPLAKSLIEDMGGTVWAESVLGEGSVFGFKI